MCHSCMKDATSSRERKTCCVYGVEHLCLKSQIVKPAVVRQIVHVSLALMPTHWLLDLPLPDPNQSFHNLASASPPAPTLELLRTLRI